MKRFFFGAVFSTFVIGMVGHQVNRPVNASQDDNLAGQCRRDYQVSMLNLLMDSVYSRGRYNGVVLVANQGEVIFKKAYGYTKTAPFEPYTVQSNMQLASVSKPFTAVATLMLIERGLINYDDDITTYLPSLRYKGITVRHLLNHTSGLPDYLNRAWLYKKYLDPEQDGHLTNQDMLQILAKGKIALEFEPGSRHRYSNTGYALLPLIIEKVSGQPFADFMQEYIFHRVGMKNTTVFDPAKPTKMLREHDARDGILGDKGIFSTVEDMFLWDQALYSDQLVRPATLDSAFAAGTTLNDEKFNYGYGWRLSNANDGGRVIYHKGYWQGATPMLIRYVDRKRTVISLHHANRVDSWIIASSANHIMDQSEFKCRNY